MSVYNAYLALSGMIDGQVSSQERMAHHTSFRIGGPADLVVRCDSYAALTHTIDILETEEIEWAVMGKGTNVLVSDEGYRGCVIKLGRDFSRITPAHPDTPCLIGAGAAVPLSNLVHQAYKRSCSGLEFCVGIPGSVGGAVSMDAGTRTEWIGQVIHDVVTYVPGQGMRRLEAGDIEWAYRSTSLAHSEIVLEASFELHEAAQEEIAHTMDRLLAKRKRNQPMGKPTCGSVFMNPEGGSVGAMLDACGLKGESSGGARISPQHANFIENEGGARAADVLKLMELMHRKVKDNYHVSLSPEVKFLGFSS